MGAIQSWSIFRAGVLLVVATAGAGCSDSLFYGESTEFNFALHFNDNPQQPLEVNIGLKRHVGQVTPPVATEQNESGKAAVGEAVSTLSGFRLRYQEEAGSASPLNNDLYIRTQFATGAAAAELAKNPIQAVKVIDADFVSDPTFVSEANRTARGEVIEGIRRFDASKVSDLSCHPPVTNTRLLEIAEQSDPGCVKRADPDFARQFLIELAFEDDRTPASFAKWRSALGMN
jgi:hypothetical protein